MARRYLVRNMGRLDRAVRALLVAPAAIVVAVALGTGSTGGIVLLVLAGVAVATGATGVCPTYAVVGLDTRGGHRPPPGPLRGEEAGR